MPRLRMSVVSAAILGVALVVAPAASADPCDKVHVVLNPGHNVAVEFTVADGEDPRDVLRDHGIRVERLTPVPDGWLASFKQPLDERRGQELLDELRADPRVRYAQHDRCRHFLPGDELPAGGRTGATPGATAAPGTVAATTVEGQVLTPPGVPLPQRTYGVVHSPSPTPRDLLDGRTVAWDPSPPDVVEIRPDGGFTVDLPPPSGDDPAGRLDGPSLRVAGMWDETVVPLPRPPLGPTRTGDPPCDGPGDDPSDLPDDPFVVPGPPPPTFFNRNEEDDEEHCCGMKAGVITYPITSDPLQPPDPELRQLAPHDPAVGAFQVMLHDGSFYEDETDLVLDGLGTGFRVARSYRGNVTQDSGGTLGQRWDLNLNKRIVPVARHTDDNGLFVELMYTDTPELMYYDGHGRGNLYVAKHSEFREVDNFNAHFWAYVSTYASPPGAFHEIQRYILVGTPRVHPFADHPNVEPTERIFYVVRMKDGLQYVFNCRGQMIYAIDRFYNMTDFRYGGPWNPLTQNRMLSAVFDPSGREYGVTPTFIGHGTVLTNVECRLFSGNFEIPRFGTISDPTGRSVVFHYETIRVRADDGSESEEPLLAEVERKLGPTTTVRYGYDDGGHGLLERITAPREVAAGGSPYLVNTYRPVPDSSPPAFRVTGQRVGADGEYVLDYGDGETTVTDPNGNSRRSEIARFPGGYVTSRLTITGTRGPDRGPWATAFEHNPATQVTAIDYPDGNRVAFEYDGNHGPFRLGPIRNWANHQVTYENNLAAGNLIGVTWTSRRLEEPYPTTSVSRRYEWLYNQLSAKTDANDNTTTFHYDYAQALGSGLAGNPIRMELPALSRPEATPLVGIKYGYDYFDSGLLREVIGPGGLATTYGYDANGYLVSVTRPTGTRTIEPDARGYVVSDTSPGDSVTTYEVDGRGLVTTRTDDAEVSKNVTRFEYDLNDNLTCMVHEVHDNFERETPPPAMPESVNPWTLATLTSYDLLDRPVLTATSGVLTDCKSHLVQQHINDHPDSGMVAWTRREYDGNGNETLVTRPAPSGAGTVSDRSTYDGRNLRTSLVEAAGSGADERTTRYFYDANGNLTAVESPHVETDYDVDGNPGEPRQLDPWTTTFEYDGFDRMVVSSDPGDAVTLRELDPAGNLLRLTFEGPTGEPGRTPAGVVGSAPHRATLSDVRFEYDELDRRIRQTAALLDDDTGGGGGEVETRWLYGDTLKIASVVGPGPGETRYDYDPATGRLSQVVDPLGNATINDYDDDGNRVAVTRETLEHHMTEGVTDDGAPQRFLVPDDEPRRTRWSFDYDGLGRIIRQDGPQGTTHQFFDSLGNLRGVHDDQGSLTEIAYDRFGRRSLLTTPVGTTAWVHGPGGLLRSVRSPVQSQIWSYDLHGNPTSEVDETSDATTLRRYDASDNEVWTRQPTGTVIRRAFDAHGLPTDVRITPAYTEYTVATADGQATERTWFGPNEERYRYDGLGRTVFAETSQGIRVETTYDGLNRVRRERQTLLSDTQTVEVAYDGTMSGRGVTYPEAAGGLSVDCDLDALGRVTSVKDGSGTIASYDYDGTQRVARRWYRPNGIQTYYDYDAAGRLDGLLVSERDGLASSARQLSSTIARFHGPSPGEIVNRFYDARGETEASATRLSYDELGRMVSGITTGSLRHPEGGDPLFSESGTLRRYDSVGRVVAEAEYVSTLDDPESHAQGGAWTPDTLSFDERDLTLARTDRFSYDASGRVASTESRASHEDELSGSDEPAPGFDDVATAAADGGFADTQEFEYDRNGNLIGDDRYIYSYDHENRLTRIYDTWSPWNQAVEFWYDGLGRRVFQRHQGKTLTLWGPPPYRSSTRFLYLDTRVLAEIGSADADAPDPYLLARYVYGARDGELIRMERRRDDAASGPLDTYFLHEDVQGKVQLLTTPERAAKRTRLFNLPPHERADAPTSPPGDLLVVEGTRTRSPYESWNTRLDSFAGVTFDTGLGLAIHDYANAPTLVRLMAEERYRESITRMTNKATMLMMSIAVLPFIPASATMWVPGLISVAVSATVTVALGGRYTLEDAYWDFVTGAIAGRVGQAFVDLYAMRSVQSTLQAVRRARLSYGIALRRWPALKLIAADIRPGVSYTAMAARGLSRPGTLSRLGVGFATDVTENVTVDVGYFDRPAADALANAVIGSVISTGIGHAIGHFRLVDRASALLRGPRGAEARIEAPTAHAGDADLGGTIEPHPAGRRLEELNGAECAFCFAAGTQVLTDAGPRDIESLRVGDRVLSRDAAAGRSGFKRVTRTWVNHPSTLVHLVYRPRGRESRGRALAAAAGGADDPGGGDDPDDPDDELVGTPGHPFRSATRGDWTPMGELVPGELLVLADGTTAEVVDLWVESAAPGASFTTYNFEVEDWHSYFVGSDSSSGFEPAVWVHNCSEDLALGLTKEGRLRQFAKRVDAKIYADYETPENPMHHPLGPLFGELLELILNARRIHFNLDGVRKLTDTIIDINERIHGGGRPGERVFVTGWELYTLIQGRAMRRLPEVHWHTPEGKVLKGDEIYQLIDSEKLFDALFGL